MTQEEIGIITDFIIRYGFEGFIAGVVAFFLIKFSLLGYLTEKGKNLATKEDVGEITRIVEGIKTDNSVLLEELKSKHQLKLAAIDRRLEVHQEAFTLWRELMSKVHTVEIHDTVIKCQTWWVKNCLYLEPEAREAFSKAYHSAAAHNGFLQSRDNVELVKQNWSIIIGAGQVILEVVQLPRLTEAELKELPKE